MSELKPCPFCGGEASKRLFYGGKYRVHCNDCDAHSGDTCDTEAEAISAWNTRTGGYCAYAQPTDLTDGCALLEERTCKNNAPDYLDFLCSECGFVHYHSDANDAGEGNEWNHCPNCGAKVAD